MTDTSVPLYVLLIAAMIATSAIMAACVVLFRHPVTEGYRIREEAGRKLQGARFKRSAVINSVLSVSMVFGLSYGLYDRLFYESSASVWRIAGEAAGVLLVYDFVYYLAHRFLFHGPLMSRHHAVHHSAKYPIAVDSLYIHPLETVVGVLILFGSVLAVGPVHVYAFAAAFMVYSPLNVLIHSGLDVRWLPLRPIGYMARKHDTHHMGMRRGNYASITPIFDVLLGTAE